MSTPTRPLLPSRELRRRQPTPRRRRAHGAVGPAPDRTRSTPATAPARGAARRSGPATPSTRRCAPPNGRLVAVNATGCLEVFSTPYPETSWRIAWLHSLFGNAPAVATGVAAAMKVKGRTDVRVVAQAGDGGTVDIGFGCLSGMFERNDDVLFICYDNEAYMNTGVQRSGATPPAARTATTEAVGPEPGNVFGQGKDLPRIAMAHDIPYVATATVADLHDLEDKVERAMDCTGPATSTSSSRARSAGGPRRTTRSKSPGSRRRPASSRSSRRTTARSPPCRRSATAPRSRSICRSNAATRHLFGEHGRPDIVARIQEIADGTSPPTVL